MSRKSHVRKGATIVGALVAVTCLAVTACSSKSKSTASSSTTGASTAAAGGGGAASGTPIKIAYGASMSGPQAANGLGAQGVAHAWQQYTNAHGGILGHPVDITMQDSKNTVPGATSVMQGFIADKSYDAIFLTDLVAEGFLVDTVKGSDVAIISGGGSSDTFWTGVPNVFQDVSGSQYTIKAYVDQAKIGGATKFGWAACAEVAVCQANGGKAQTYAGTQSMTPTGVQLVSASASDYTAQCLAFIGKGTDSIAFNIGYPVGARFATDCLQQGYRGTFSVINSGFDQATFAKVAGFKSVGGTQGFPWWSTNPAVQTYNAAMKQYSPGTATTSGNSTSIWTSFELFKKALEDAKPATIDRASVLAAMYQVKNETLGGLLPQPITYTQGQPSQRINCSWLFKFNAGESNPTSIPPSGQSGNSASGDLASTCLGYLPNSNGG
jgi:branched-chain amino acid transport system substrate-binding protein